MFGGSGIKNPQLEGRDCKSRPVGDGQLFYPMQVNDAAKLVRATSKPFPGAFIINNNFKLIIYEAQVIAEEAYIGPYLKFADGFLAILDIKMETL